jgi:hypothetical protein
VIDLFTSTVDAAAAFERQHAFDVYDDGPSLGDARDDQPSTSLPDPYLCIDPWCPTAVEQPRHLHGTRPDGVWV